MGGACDMYGGEEKCIQILVGNLNERDQLVVIGVSGRIILKGI
jgi:hypothetical protein